MKRFIALLSILSVAACAVIQPPPGGPEDKKPPHIVRVVPAPDSAGVARDAVIRITFSEKVDESTFKERIKLYPSVAFEGLKVRGEELEIRFAEDLPETTFSVLVLSGYRDWHNVANKKNFVFQFSTAESLLAGEIEGWILYKEKPDSNGVVRLFEVRGDSSAVSVKSDVEARTAFCNRDGGFTFRALPSDSARFIVWAFSDKNRDGSFAESNEFSAVYDDTVLLTPDNQRAEEIRINIIDPNEPGSISGRVVNETEMPRYVTLRFEPLLPGEKALVVTADSTGHFIAPRIPPGRYLVTAFIDMEQDSLCGRYTSPADSTVTFQEPCLALPDTLDVEPGSETMLDTVTLERARQSE